MGIRLRTPPPTLFKDNMCPFPVRTVCSLFDPKVDQIPDIPAPTTPSLGNTWFPDTDTQKQQYADSEGAKKEWANPDVFLSTWTSVMADRSGVPSTNVARMYDQFSKTSQRRSSSRRSGTSVFPFRRWSRLDRLNIDI